MLRRFGRFMRNMFVKERVEKDLGEEVHSYAELLEDEKRGRGLHAEDARRAANLELGGEDQVKEIVRAARAGVWIETLWQDVRFGARQLRKNPGFTAVAVLTLMLGIGANTAIFSVVYAVLLRPLPFSHPDELVRVHEAKYRDTLPSERLEVAPANYFDWQRDAKSFRGLAAYATEQLPLVISAEPEQVYCAFVSHNFFSLLEVQPFLGRGFTETEDHAGHDTVALLSYGMWQSRFGGDRNVLGRTIKLDGKPYAIVGVMPAGFEYPLEISLWTPLGLNDNQVGMREAHFLKVIGRLRPGTTLSQARSETEGLAQRLEKAYPATNKNWRINVVPLLENEVGRVRPALLMLTGAAGLLLLIACVNAASLQLARATSRQAEFATRLALGASPERLVRGLLTESLLLAVLGGAMGLWVASWGISALLAMNPWGLPRSDTVGIDRTVLAMTLAFTALTGLLAGLLPAKRALQTNLQDALKEGTQRAGRSVASQRSFSALVAGEIALAVVVLAGAGLLIRSFVKIWGVDCGFDANGVLTAEIKLPDSRYGSNVDWQKNRLYFYSEVLGRLQQNQQVEAAAGAESVPLAGFARIWSFRREKDSLPPSERPVSRYEVVTRNYFRVMRIALRRGRDFRETDNLTGAPVMIINESLARRFFPREEAIGQRIIIRNQSQAREIIGIAGDVRHAGLDQPVAPAIYVPFEQMAVGSVPIVVRTRAGDPMKLAGAVRATVNEVDPEVAIARIRPMLEVLSDSLAPRRFALLLLGFLAGAAVFLATIGIYGVTAYSVGQRTHEIGLRMALGAQSRDVMRLVLWQGFRYVGAGVATGVLGALIFGRAVRGMLFEIVPDDPLTLLGVAALLVGVSLAATYLPARRALRVDPMVALRYE